MFPFYLSSFICKHVLKHNTPPDLVNRGLSDSLLIRYIHLFDRHYQTGRNSGTNKTNTRRFVCNRNEKQTVNSWIYRLVLQHLLVSAGATVLKMVENMLLATEDVKSRL